jgi:hypothetical protein
MKKAIEMYQEEQLIKINSDHQMFCNEIVEEQLLQDGENFENFLRSDQIHNVLSLNDRRMVQGALLHALARFHRDQFQ